MAAGLPVGERQELQDQKLASCIIFHKFLDTSKIKNRQHMLYTPAMAQELAPCTAHISRVGKHKAYSQNAWLLATSCTCS
eukprot:scaffold46921_cov20-Tisochrysis_lutea.AAC.1